RRRVAKVAGNVRKALRQTAEDVFVELLARADDRLTGALDELVDRPLVDGDAEDRTVEQAALLEPVERAEGHHLGEVARDPEDHEMVGRSGLGARRRGRLLDFRRCFNAQRSPLSLVAADAASAVCSTRTSSRPSSSMRAIRP